MKMILSFTLIIITFLFCILLISIQTPYALDDGPYYTFMNDLYIEQIICNNHLDTMSLELRAAHNVVFGVDSLCSEPRLSVSVPVMIVFEQTPVYDTASTLFVISDFHGEFESMCGLLLNNKIITPEFHWAFGDGRLVINGDMVDRGDKVTEILWLIYRLEEEAQAAGGKVHFLLGNHEIMIMQGDLRYINPKYDTVCTMLHTTYDKLYSNETVLGQWLRSKPIMMKINDILFVHGGYNPAFVDSGYSIDIINEFYREHIDDSREDIRSDSLANLLFGSRGPTWYRGYFDTSKYYPLATVAEIDKILTYFDVSRIIVGHTGQDSIMTFYDGKVIGVNIDYEDSTAYEGLFISSDSVWVGDYQGHTRLIVNSTKD